MTSLKTMTAAELIQAARLISAILTATANVAPDAAPVKASEILDAIQSELIDRS